MAEKGFKRKLTAILSADVEGYSRLMGQDEEATVRTLTAYREVLTTLIHQHNGKVLDSPGDNLLAEFASVVDAVQCAVAVQKEIKARNEELPENRRMQFRIGINLGDVIQEEDRIYGDGVNIAARLEGLAEPGGICISKTAFDHIESKLPYGYEFLGDQRVKNIAKPVGAYRVLMEPRVTVAEKLEKEKPAFVRRMPMMIGAIALLAIAISLMIWQFYIRRPSVETASVEKMAFTLPDKPSIAVLPFDNLSGDPEQEYFCDGMTEDLITDLSKIAGIFVIARNSTFTYKGKPVKIKQVAEELGVRYVLEGSVRKAEDKVRINAQLIDAINGHHLWAERYTGKIGDVFSLQDKITQNIVNTLAVKLGGGEQEYVTQKETDNIEAYDNFLKGWSHYLRFTPEDIEKAQYFFWDAISLDPNYGRAWAASADCYEKEAAVRGKLGIARIARWNGIRSEARARLIKAMNNPTSLAYQVAAEMESKQHLHDAAMDLAKRALALEPNNPSCLAVLGKVLIMAGKSEEGIDFVNKAKRFDPYNPSRYQFLLGLADFSMDQMEEAATLFERAITNNPEFYIWRAILAATYAHLGRTKAAQEEIAKFKNFSYWTPTLEFAMYFFPFKDSATADRLANGLIKAGLPKGHLGYYTPLSESRLTGEKIKQLLFGQVVEGVDPWTGVPYKIDIGKDGKAAYMHKFYFTSYSGKSWIEGEKLCYQWSGLFNDYTYCSPVFRNIKPSSDTTDDFLLATDWGIYPFSLVD